MHCDRPASLKGFDSVTTVIHMITPRAAISLYYTSDCEQDLDSARNRTLRARRRTAERHYKLANDRQQRPTRDGCVFSSSVRREVSHAGETGDGVHHIQQHQRKDLADTNELLQHKSRC